jgi:Activator of Hsp90 ATPase homolog 1-like protein
MAKEFKIRWEGELPARPQQVWDAFTLHTTGWYWKISYEPWVGGAEQGLAMGNGKVTVWDPPRHFVTRVDLDDGKFNQLEYRLEPRGDRTHLLFVHTSGIDEKNYDQEYDACEQHTAFYYHSLGEYLRYFSPRDAAYFRSEAPDASAKDGMAAMRSALNVGDDVAAGDQVRLTPAGMEPIDGVVDYTTPAFLGVRSADALYRFYGLDAWEWPVGVAHHLFADGADEEISQKAWSSWLNELFTLEWPATSTTHSRGYSTEGETHV